MLPRVDRQICYNRAIFLVLIVTAWSSWTVSADPAACFLTTPTTPAASQPRTITSVSSRRGRQRLLPLSPVSASPIGPSTTRRQYADSQDQEGEEADEADEADGEAAATATEKRPSRWEALSPRLQARIVRIGQERAIANKMKREPEQEKKRRMMMFVKEKKLDKKKAARVKRPLSFGDRTPLSALIPGMQLSGVVISLTNFGAYVDVGTECDGLLHVSQMSPSKFVDHPKQVVAPGDEVTVRVRSRSPEKKKLHLTMLPKELILAEDEQEYEMAERIALDEIQVDDELWGQIKRVTNYGAYVELGAQVPGFLHFMDHPAFGWSNGEHPSAYMAVGDRVRVWAVDVDTEQNRLKLTANRPAHLPGPRREL